MQMKDRTRVEGTEPTVYIGHRISRRPGGKIVVSRTYHAEYSFDGRQRSKTLRTNNKSVAIRAAHALSEQLRTGVEVKPFRKVSVADITAAYVASLEAKGRAKSTLQKYRFNLNEFSNWWANRGGGLAMRVTEQDFWEYRKWLSLEGKSDQTIEDRLILVKQMFKWAWAKAKLLATNPLADATVPEPPPTQQPCFTPEQIEAILNNCRPQERPVFTMMAYTGMRVGEVAALRWDDVILDRGQYGFIAVRLGGSNGTTKGKRSRFLPIHPELRQVLDSMPRRCETVFTRPKSAFNPDGSRPLNQSTLLKSIKRLCKKLGFPNHDKYKIHTFRHSFASMCARNQVSYKYALDWMGHKSSDILDMYVTQFDAAAEHAIGTINYPVATARATGSSKESSSSQNEN